MKDKIKKFFTNLWWKPYGWYLNICNILAWTPLLWKDREWDYGFMLEMERFKLRRMCKWYLKNNYGHAVNGESTYKQMKFAADLLDIILDNDWYIIKDIDKPIFVDGKFFKHPDSDYVLSTYVNLRNYKRFLPWLKQETVDKAPNFWSTEVRVAKAWSLYHKFSEHYMQGWWD